MSIVDPTETGAKAAEMTQVAAESIFARGEAALNADNLVEAALCYRELLRANVSPGLMLQRLGIIANRCGDFDAAWTCHTQALEIEPGLASLMTRPEVAHHTYVFRNSYELQTVDACPVCHATRQRVVNVINSLDMVGYHAAVHPIRRWVRCEECGHGFVNPRPSARAFDDALAEAAPFTLTYLDYPVLMNASEIIHGLWTRKPGGDLLDVGVAQGALAATAQDFGFNVTAIDIRGEYAEALKRFDIELLVGDIVDYDFGPKLFDVITVGDVIEHVADIHTLVRRFKTLLKPEGLLWISTPNIDGAWTRWRKDTDAMWKESEHLHYFSRASLTRLLNQYGLNVVDFRLSKRYIGCMELTITTG